MPAYEILENKKIENCFKDRNIKNWIIKKKCSRAGAMAQQTGS